MQVSLIIDQCHNIIINLVVMEVYLIIDQCYNIIINLVVMQVNLIIDHCYMKAKIEKSKPGIVACAVILQMGGSNLRTIGL